MTSPEIPEEGVEQAAGVLHDSEHVRLQSRCPGLDDCQLWYDAEFRAAVLLAALPHLRVHETASKCLDCEHTHTPDGCTGQPSPSDVWAGVTPSICDCPSLRVQEMQPDGLREALAEVLAVYDDVHGGKVGAAGSRERIYYGVSSDIRGMLAAHPAPLPRPVVDREALERILADHAVGRHVPRDAARYRTVIADGVLALTNGRTAKTEPL